MNKAFTLIELLAVIVILSIILVVAIPKILKIIEDTKTKVYIQNEKIVVNAVKYYLTANPDHDPVEVGETTEITINDLITNGYIKEIKSPENKNQNCNGYVLITKTNTNEYDYTPHINCITDVGNSSEDGLVAHYKLDNNALDSSVNANHCNIIGSPTVSEGAIKKSYEFTSSSNYIDCGHISSVIDLTGDLTISFWTYLYAFPASRAGVFQTAYGAEMAINVDAIGGLQWYQGESGIEANPYESFSSNGYVFSVNKWVNITIVRNSSSMTRSIYCNGVLNREIPYSLNVVGATSSYPLVLGKAYTGTLNGRLDDIMIYDRVLTTNEIKHYYEITKAST